MNKWLTKERKAVLKSYARGVIVSALTLITSNALGLPTEISVVLSAIAAPAIKYFDTNEKEFGKK